MKCMYQQSMVQTFYVWATSEEEATEIIGNAYHEVPHEWNPDLCEVVRESERDYCCPINEED